jgi:hypothetical protein
MFPALVSWRRIARIIGGALVWCLVLFQAWRLLVERHESGPSTVASLADYCARREGEVRVVFARPVLLEAGDVVESGGKQVGEVSALLDGKGGVSPAIYAWTRAARVRIYDRSSLVLRAGANAKLVQVPQTAAWVVQTLFTKETIPRLAEEWNNTMLEHRDEIFALLTPIVRDLILDVERHVETELPGFLERHGDEVREISEKLKRDLGGEKLSTIFEKDIWPIAQPKVRPIVEQVSRELWEKLPLWSLTWRLAYQTLPLTDNDHLQRAFVEFLEKQAMPILKSHSEEVMEVVRQVAHEAFANEEVTSTVRQVFGSLLAEPKFHELCQVFIRELVLDNPSFHDAMKRRWQSPEVQLAIERASAHIEPMVRRMGDIVLGTREEGISREFARVLRSQILLKDLQRIVIDAGPDDAARLGDDAVLEARIESELIR